MNAKNVVNAVLNHHQPDYIPLGTYAIDCDTVEKILGHETYVRNKIKIQIALWEGRRDEVVQSLKEDSVELFKKLDCIDVIIPFKEAMIVPPKGYVPPKVRKLEENIWEEENGTVYRYSELTNDITIVKYPLEYKDYGSEPKYVPPDESIFEAYDHLVEQMKGERFLVGLSGGFNALVLLGGMENGLMEYYLNPDLVRSAIRYTVDVQNQNDLFYIREGLDQVFIEEDYATTTSSLISPDIFREFCLPAIKERVKNIKQFRSKVILHSCGNSWKLIDMLVEAGIDGYQSLQTGANMDLKELKNGYGKKLCFWGGVSVENLISGTPDSIREDVRYAMKYGSPDGGFILGPSHSIAYGVKYDNFMTMLDEHSKLKYIK